jgi:hypothetical protein
VSEQAALALPRRLNLALRTATPSHTSIQRWLGMVTEHVVYLLPLCVDVALPAEWKSASFIQVRYTLARLAMERVSSITNSVGLFSVRSFTLNPFPFTHQFY